MSDYGFDLRPLVWLGAIVALAVWGCWGLVDYLWIDDAIRVTEPIQPTIEYEVHNNVIDTIYVYRKP